MNYSLLTEYSSDVVWLLDIETQRFLYVSPAVERLRGITVEEALKESMEDTMTDESFKRVMIRLNAAFDHLKFHPDDPYYATMDIQQYHKDGSLVWVEVATRFKRDEQGRLQIIGVSRNAHERKKTEERLKETLTQMEMLIEEVKAANENLEVANRRLEKKNISIEAINEQLLEANRELANANEELEVANAEKNRFFSIISHDLRSPMATIVGFAELMLDKQANVDEGQCMQYVKHIRDTGMRSMDMLEGMVTWARAASGRLIPSPAEVRMECLLRDIALFYEPIAARKEIQIQFTAMADGCEVYADHAMLRTLFGNLISNAIKFSNTNGKIEVTLECDSSWVTVRVKDNGIGMPSAILENLFKVDNTTKREGTGKEPSSGLGLLICMEFADLHDGEIEVRSVEGEGSVFTVHLPVHKKA
ncbi:MAG: PAS domain S-box protein [Bacteroidetes bacterium]|nr:PAS domain S-box protein [Bacteroidota bacterium]MCH8525229.1 PAS domain-containing sensor histidine kinase [Balneolales bacterium]